jgi:folylpolyglutamate synthase/dihydropteroate synthase
MTAKTRLIETLKQFISDNEYSPKVYEQQNAILASEVLEQITSLNLVQCEKIERKINEIQKPGKFGTIKVSPTDYLQFI